MDSDNSPSCHRRLALRIGRCYRSPHGTDVCRHSDAFKATRALDWSLVLVNQGIKAPIEPASSRNQLASWTDMIRKGHPGHPPIQNGKPWAGLAASHCRGRRLIFDWHNLAWFPSAGRHFLFQQGATPILTEAGVMDRQAVLVGQWWRLLRRHPPATGSSGIQPDGGVLLAAALGGFGSGSGCSQPTWRGRLGIWPGCFSTRDICLGASGMIFGARPPQRQMIGLSGWLTARQLAIQASWADSCCC
mgnify:CR=1 FL=1